jgi:uncharacterized protein
LDQPDLIDSRLLAFDASLQPVLRAGRDRLTGRIVFPWADGRSDHEEIALPRRGTLWSWTVQRFPPKSPPYAGAGPFQPYAVGYVDLGVVIVEARLTGAPLDAYRIGLPMVLVAERFVLADDQVRLTFAFAPEGEPS